MKPGPNYRAFTFINAEYIEKGAALFGRETEASLQDFREAIGSAVDDADDEEIYAIIQFAVQRVRMIRKICSLKAARYKYARIDGEMDRERFPISALMDGKYFRVGIAALNLETFAQLSIEEQASILNRACDRAADENFFKGIAFEEGEIIPDFLIWEGLGHAPFHRLCACTALGVDKEEVDGPHNRTSSSVKLNVSVRRG